MSDFHVGYKWGSEQLPSSASASVLWLGTRISPAGTHGHASFSLMQSVLNQCYPPHPRAGAEGRWRLLHNCRFCPIPSQILLFLSPYSLVSLFAESAIHGTVTLFSGSPVPVSPVCPSLPAPWTLDSMLLPSKCDFSQWPRTFFLLGRPRFCHFSR